MRGRYEQFLFFAVRRGAYVEYRILCFCEDCRKPIIGDGYPAFCDVCWG